MKRGIIFLLILLILPSVYSREIDIPELFEIEGKVSINQDGKEVYYYAGSKLIAVNGQYQYQDRLGSDFGSRSLPFGQVLDIDNRFSFTGKEHDEDLYYFGARYYDPSLGKFTSVDPVKENHPYAYVENNPMNFVDPDGMDDNELRQEYEIDMENVHDFSERYMPGRLTEENRERLGELIIKSFEEGMKDAQKKIVSELTQEELDELGFSEDLPNLVLHFNTVRGEGNFAHVGIWKDEEDESTYHIRVSAELIPAMFIKEDIIRHEGDLSIKKSDARIVKKVTTLAVGVIYGQEPSLSFWERQRFGWQIGHSKHRSGQSAWYADLVTLFNRMHPNKN